MNLARQSVLYLIFGLIQLVVDWLCFVALTWFGMGTVSANLIGRVSGALLGFWLNGKHTFGITTQGKLRPAHLARFIVMWGFTAAASTAAVTLADSVEGLYFAWLVKPFFDALLAVFGFLLSKFWVYR
ncbi:MAG: GtrA family protein [Proteobacteria bacterium]|nr:GtrA family protein [Pseudomonadota bacterium]MCL2307499.1 GtrA family protein [Pseudomonadota bacterium]